MRTTIDLDEDLLKQVLDATGEKSKTKAVNKAMEEFIRAIRIKHLRSLRGKLDLDFDEIHKLREMEHDHWKE
jgi:Arc/MetJ family transcription regulator